MKPRTYWQENPAPRGGLSRRLVRRLLRLRRPAGRCPEPDSTGGLPPRLLVRPAGQHLRVPRADLLLRLAHGAARPQARGRGREPSAGEREGLAPRKKKEREGELLARRELMDLTTLTYLVVGASFALYIGIAFWSKAQGTGDFYVAGKHVHPVANGMATAADWMSAASFISMAGTDRLPRLRRLRVLDGLDGGLRAPRVAARAVPPEVRQVHGPRVHRRALLLADRPGRRGRLPHHHLVHLCRGPDARRRHRLLALPRRGHHHGPAGGHGRRVLLRRARRHEGDHLHPGRPNTAC